MRPSCNMFYDPWLIRRLLLYNPKFYMSISFDKSHIYPTIEKHLTCNCQVFLLGLGY